MNIGFFLLKSFPTMSRSCDLSSSLAFSSFFPLLMNGTNFFHRACFCCLFLPRSSSASFSLSNTVLSPSDCSSESAFLISCNSHSFSRVELVISSWFLFSHSCSTSSPFFCISLFCRLRMDCILPLALAVLTKFIHDGCTCCDFELSISTWSPLCSLWLSGTSLWFTLAPMQWLPRKVCIWKAKSRAVHPAGIVLISPFGVKTNISEANRFSLIASRKSIASGCGSSSISLMVRSQSFSSPSSSIISAPSLYFQWAANPCSAISSILLDRICTSIHCPCFDISVTCSAWYPLAFGWFTQSRSRSGWLL